MYVVRGDDRYDPPSRYMVSNAVVMGKMKTSTKPRDWTAEEITRCSKAAACPTRTRTVSPTIGEDVPSLPTAVGSSSSGTWTRTATFWAWTTSWATGTSGRPYGGWPPVYSAAGPTQAAPGPVDCAKEATPSSVPR